MLAFATSLIPRVFVQCIEVAIAPLRQQGIHLATYLEDWLLLAQSKQDAQTHTCFLLRRLRDLDFVVNRE